MAAEARSVCRVCSHQAVLLQSLAGVMSTCLTRRRRTRSNLIAMPAKSCCPRYAAFSMPASYNKKSAHFAYRDGRWSQIDQNCIAICFFLRCWHLANGCQLAVVTVKVGWATTEVVIAQIHTLAAIVADHSCKRSMGIVD